MLDRVPLHPDSPPAAGFLLMVEPDNRERESDGAGDARIRLLRHQSAELAGRPPNTITHCRYSDGERGGSIMEIMTQLAVPCLFDVHASSPAPPLTQKLRRDRRVISPLGCSANKSCRRRDVVAPRARGPIGTRVELPDGAVAIATPRNRRTGEQCEAGGVTLIFVPTPPLSRLLLPKLCSRPNLVRQHDPGAQTRPRRRGLDLLHPGLVLHRQRRGPIGTICGLMTAPRLVLVVREIAVP